VILIGNSYNPWNTFAEHTPVGNVSQARHRVYHVSAMERMTRLNLTAIPKCPFLSLDRAPVTVGDIATPVSDELLPQSIATATNVYCMPLDPPAPTVKVDGDAKTQADSDSAAKKLASSSSSNGASLPATVTVTPAAPAVAANATTSSSSTSTPATAATTPSLAPTTSTASVPSTPLVPPVSLSGVVIGNTPNRSPGRGSGVDRLTGGRTSFTRGGGGAPPSPILSHGTPVLISATQFKLAPAASTAGLSNGSSNNTAVTGTPPPTGGARTAVVYLED
jgi:hypothetical protein